MAGKIWFDVDDLHDYVANQARPSGIQRLEFELCRALTELDPTGGRIGFLCHDPVGQAFETIDWADIARGYAAMTQRPVAPAPQATSVKPPSTALRQLLRGRAYRLSAELRQPLLRAYFHQRQAVAAFGALLGATTRHARASLARRAARGRGGARTPLAAVAEPDDMLVTLGGHWDNPDYARMVAAARRDLGVRYGVLLYDLIAIRRPEWCAPDMAERFRGFVDALLPLADTIWAISEATAADIVRHAAANAIPLRAAPVRLPIGTGFTTDPRTAPDDGPARELPEPGTYALTVCTIEVRKNHLLLLHLWRRLLDEVPRETVPTLVLAGRIGWLADDFVAQLRNCDFLGGKIRLVEAPTDDELARLYQGCRFTLYPSFYEGWGLPVTESLGYGQPCLASGTTSVPEAGGDLARYFDPTRLPDAYAAVCRAIVHPDEVAVWREEIRRRFVPRPWRDAAAALLAAVA